MFVFCGLGARSLMLIETPGGGKNNFPDGEEETHMTFDLLNDDFAIPAVTTYYNRKLHKLPDLATKNQVVKVSLITRIFH